MKKIITIITLVLIFSLSLVACGDIPADNSGNTESQASNSEQTEVATQEQMLVDNANIKVSFIEIFEEPSISGVCYLRLKVENRTDKTVTVYPKDAYVNGMSVMLGSGVPMEILPDKSSQTPFFFSYGNLDITSKDEIEDIEFKIWLVDENFDTIDETEALIIDFDK